MSPHILLKKIREKKNLKQSVVADQLGISQGTLSKLESGAIPLTVDMLIKFARLIGEPASIFFPAEK